MVNSADAAENNHSVRYGRSERRERLQFEALETRNLMSADPLTVNVGASADAAALDAMMAQTQVTALATHYTSPIGYTPAQIAAAYGFNSIKFGNVVGNGAGQTIAIVDAYDDPDIAGDLQTFDKQFGLAAPKFTEVKQTSNGKGPMASAGWSMEISLDVEWAHAMAPGANIELVEAYTPSLGNLLSCVQFAAAQPGVSVVSMSWGSNEFSSETSYNSSFTTPSGHTGVSFVASSGDSGAGALWPAISTNVLSVGGTSLTLNKNGTYGSETAWSGSGGGPSQYQSEASYEKGVQTTGKQMDPDVSYDANPNTGFAVYDSVAYDGSSGWEEVGGTSAGAPQWSALVAIANQGRVINHENTLTNAAAAVFTLSSNDFHDVTSGSDGGHSAGKGYDEVTGLGTPQANLVAQGLLNVTAAQQTYTSVAASSSSVKAATSVTSKFDLAGFDDSTQSLIAGVVFTQAQASGPVSVAATTSPLVGTPIGVPASGAVAATSRDAESDAAAPLVIGSSDSALSAPLGDAASFDAVAGVSTIAGPSAASMGLASETVARLSPAGAAGLAAFMGDDSISRVDASFALETEWTSAQWIDGAFADRAILSPDGGAIEDNAEANDAEAQELSAVLLAVGAVMTTMRSDETRASRAAEDRKLAECDGAAV